MCADAYSLSIILNDFFFRNITHKCGITSKQKHISHFIRFVLFDALLVMFATNFCSRIDFNAISYFFFLKIISFLISPLYLIHTECGKCKSGTKRLNLNKFCKRDYGKYENCLFQWKIHIVFIMMVGVEKKTVLKTNKRN